MTSCSSTSRPLPKASPAPHAALQQPQAGNTLTADLVDALAHQVENIVGVKDTSGDITLTSEFIRRTRDVGFKVFGGKDTLLYASLCHGAVGGVHCG